MGPEGMLIPRSALMWNRYLAGLCEDLFSESHAEVTNRNFMLITPPSPQHGRFLLINPPLAVQGGVDYPDGWEGFINRWKSRNKTPITKG